MNSALAALADEQDTSRVQRDSGTEEEQPPKVDTETVDAMRIHAVSFPTAATSTSPGDSTQVIADYFGTSLTTFCRTERGIRVDYEFARHLPVPG
ncbi:MAG: hypothetical protein ACYCZY_10125 [Lacisediminihabitans sp.]